MERFIANGAEGAFIKPNMDNVPSNRQNDELNGSFRDRLQDSKVSDHARNQDPPSQGSHGHPSQHHSEFGQPGC